MYAGRSLSRKVRRAYESTYRAFVDLCGATGEPVEFDYGQLAAWCVFWVESGYSARTLAGHFTAFRRVAAEGGKRFPMRHTLTERRLQWLRRGLLKDAGPVNRATPLTLSRIMTMWRTVFKVKVLGDLRYVEPGVLTFITRVMVGHACMLRMCEHEDGMRVGDVSAFQMAADGSVAVSVRVRERKDHVRHESRRCGLAGTGKLWDAGSVLQLYMELMHGTSKQDYLLFPEWSSGGAYVPVPASARDFRETLQRVARQSGMAPAEAGKVRPHSLRSGGCTDYLGSGLVTEAWVQSQGGWRSSIFKIYYRPHGADIPYMHAKLAAVAALTAGLEATQGQG